MRITNLSPPPVSPVSESEAKTFLRVDHDHEDALISNLITAATTHVETILAGAILARPMRLETNVPELGIIPIPRHPVKSVEAVRAGEPLIDVDFTANVRPRPAQVNVSGHLGDPIEIDFTAGFGDTPADVPTPIRQAVLLLVAQLYEHRDGPTPPTPMMVDALLSPYRGVRL